MFKRKPPEIVRRVELSEEAKTALESLALDQRVLAEQISELLGKSREILEGLTDAVYEDDPGASIRAFEDEPPYIPVPGTKRSVPGVIDPRDRIRATPFTRAPRTEQVEWLLNEVLADGGWHCSAGIAAKYGNDERHARYLRGATSTRMREMHEDGLVERRDSQTKGSMFEYRRKP